MANPCIRSAFAFAVCCISVLAVPVTATAYSGQPEPETSADVNPAEPPPSQALPDSTWRALIDSNVELTRSDGTLVQGQLLEIAETSVTLVQADGAVVVVPKNDITAVRRFAATSPTRSEQPSQQASAQPEPSQDRRGPMSTHRGFYFAGMMGFGMPMSWDRYEGISEPYDGVERIRNPGFNIGFAFGGTPRPGLVLGVAIDTNVGSASFEDEHTGQEGVPDGFAESDGTGAAIGTSLFIQGYIKNFFIRAGFGGLGLFYISDGETTGGAGLDLGFGAHFPVGRKAALGFSVAVRGAFMGYNHDDYKGRIVIVQPLVRFEALAF